MQSIINTAADTLVGINEIKDIYIHTYRKQQQLTLAITLSTTIEQLSSESKQLCRERNFSVGEYNSSVIVELPYNANKEGYGDDLDSMSNRSLKVWSEQLVQGLLQLNKKYLMDSQLINFYWCSAHHQYSLGSNVKKIIKLSSSTGNILSELNLDNGAVLALCEHALIYLNGKTKETILHDTIEKLSDSTDSLVISSQQRKYEFCIGESDKNPANPAYFESLYGMTRPDKSLIIKKKEDIPKDKSIEFYLELFRRYYTPGERDSSKVNIAYEIAKVGMNHHPQSIRLLDFSTRTFFLTGNVEAQYQYFKICAQTHTGLDSVTWNNLIANTINSVVILGDLAEMNMFYQLHYHPQQESAPRCYYHNMACLITLLGQHSEFEPCMENAIVNQETAAAIIGENDFDSIRESEAYQRILAKAIQQDEDRGDNDVREPDVHSVYDYTELYRLNEFHSIGRIAQKRNSEANSFLRQLALEQFINDNDRQTAFFLLIALGGKNNLDAARESHIIFGGSFRHHVMFGMSEILAVVKDKNEFESQLVTIMGDKAKRLFMHID
ncbi:hypothetical protein MNBD_GAMMA12-3231 [hydrothermal vent metagenome]|uniref:Uncharacterized protein n=1 Tax=hydrothermal vent metagenome TaxID=652676 RepID=A0A3B0YQF5_9ZZZZ